MQDRLTGQLIDERMSVYVRLGMRLVYKGMKSRIQSKTGKQIQHCFFDFKTKISQQNVFWPTCR